MKGRSRISIMAGAVVLLGGAALARPARVEAAESARLCSLQCPALGGKTFCGGYCTDDGYAECDYVTTGGPNSCDIYQT